MLILLLIKNDHPGMIGKTYNCIKYKNNFNFISRRIVNWFPELHKRCWKRPNRLRDPSQITLQSVTNRCIVKRWLLEALAPPNNRWWCIKISTYSPAHLSCSSWGMAQRWLKKLTQCIKYKNTSISFQGESWIDPQNYTTDVENDQIVSSLRYFSQITLQSVAK